MNAAGIANFGWKARGTKVGRLRKNCLAALFRTGREHQILQKARCVRLVQGRAAFVALVMSLANIGRADCKFIQTTGKAHVVRVTTDGQQIPSDCYDAQFSIKLSSDGRFIIRLLNHQFYKGRKITFSFDGTNYFYVIANGTNASKSQVDAGLAYLSAEEMPLILIDDQARDALWYAVCSGSYFKKHGDSGEILELFHSPRRSVVGFGYRYRVVLTNSDFPMPTVLDVWRDKEFDKSSRALEEDRLELNADGRGSALYDNEWFGKEAIPEGSHSLSLHWKTDCVLHGVRLPTEVEITDFYAARTNPPPCLKIGLEFQPWQLATAGEDGFRPPDPKQPVRVFDARVRVRKGNHYLDELSYSLGTNPTNSRWLSTNNPWIQEGIHNIAAAQMVPGTTSKLRPIALVLAAMIAIVVPYIIVRKRHRFITQ